MDEQCVNFLNDRQLFCSIEKFKEQYIDYATLVTLNKKDIEKLVPQLGLQKKSLTSLAEHTSSKATELNIVHYKSLVDFTAADLDKITEETPVEAVLELPLQDLVDTPNSKAHKRINIIIIVL